VTDEPQAATPSRRVLAILLGLVAAAGLVYACLTEQWLVSIGAKDGFGLRHSWVCTTASDCVFTSNADTVEGLQQLDSHTEMSAAFAPAGLATFGLLAVASAALTISVLLAIAGIRRSPPVAPTTVALLALTLGLIAGCIFVATKPGAVGWVGVGLGFWVFGGSTVLGISAAQLLARVNRPPDPDLLADAMNPEQF
jgi:hypothetical protein